MTTDHQPPIVLLVYANDRVDSANHLRSLSAEIGRIRDALQAAEQAGLCQVLIEANATADRIFSVFQDARYRNRIAVLHYAGHASGYQLLLESAAGGRGAADAEGLATFLGQQRALELVFLNGCSTEQQAQGLLDANCAAVIVTSQAIDDDVAMDFASRFYAGLGSGASLEQAYNEAVAAVKTQAGRDPRALYWGDAPATKALADRPPWELRIKPGAEESAGRWNLPDAVGNPLFGLPELPTLDLPESPFRHLHWFDREHAEVFFGRGFKIRELFQAVTTADAAPIVLFYGQSGVGKSSVLDAGLLPRLKKTHRVHYLRRDQTRGLLGTLLAAFGDAQATPGEAWRKAEGEQGPPVLVVLDQAEEVFTRPNEKQLDELDRFIDGLHDIFGQRAHRPRGRLILGFRKEWLPEIEKRLKECRLPCSQVFLKTLDHDGVIEAITGPTHSTRLRDFYKLEIDDKLDEEIADDLLADRESPVAPTLQILLTKLWERAREENFAHPRFTRKLYLDLKGEGILLGDFLDQQLDDLKKWQPEVVQSGLALDVLAYHTTPNGAAARTAEDLRSRYPHQGQAIEGLVKECKKGYLLSDIPSTQLVPTEGTRLAHDTLAPLVRERFDQSDRPGQRARRILESRAVDWAKDQTVPVLDDADLEVVEKGSLGMRATSQDEARLIEASRKARDRRQAARKRWLALGVAGVLTVVLVGSFAGWQSWQLKRAADVRVKETIGYAWADLSARQEEVTRLTDVAKQNDLDPNELVAPLIETQEQPDKFDCNTSLQSGFRYFYCLVRKVISFGKLESISGLSIFSPGGPHNKEFNLSDPYQFGHYNPDFLEWFERHIIPKNINRVNQLVYNAYIGPTARALYHTHEILFASPEEYRAFEQSYKARQSVARERFKNTCGIGRFCSDPIAFTKIKADYQDLIQKRSKDQDDKTMQGGIFLENSFFWLSDYLDTTKNDSWYLASPAAGFWVRRSIDGTEDQVFQLVKKLLLTFEPEIVNSKQAPSPESANSPSPAPTTEQPRPTEETGAPGHTEESEPKPAATVSEELTEQPAPEAKPKPAATVSEELTEQLAPEAKPKPAATASKKLIKQPASETTPKPAAATSKKLIKQPAPETKRKPAAGQSHTTGWQIKKNE